MTVFEISLVNDRQVSISGDAIERVPRDVGGFEGRHPQYTPYATGDLLVWREGRVVAWYKNKEVAGYCEADMPTSL